MAAADLSSDGGLDSRLCALQVLSCDDASCCLNLPCQFLHTHQALMVMLLWSNSQA